MSGAAQLFDAILHEKGIRTDGELAEEIGIEPTSLSRLRHGHRPVSDGVILRVHEMTGWSIHDIKVALAMPSRKGRPLQ
jgi:plasmid maintenance system antidote protein VapI